MRALFVGGAIGVMLLAACGSLSSVGVDLDPPDVDAGASSNDAAVETNPDATATVDASTDASADVAADAPADALVDAKPDAAIDAGPEVVSSVVVARTRTCFVMSTGRLFCAGDGTVTPTVVAGVTDAVEVTIGGGNGGTALHTCVRRKAGTVDCWGNNSDGQLGDGTTVTRATPATIAGLSNVVQLSSGTEATTCARLASGAVMCWGDNAFGNLGDGTTTDRAAPVAVSGLTDAIDIAVGGGGACAIRTGGQAVCWGYNDRGELGDGSFDHGRCISGALNVDCSLVPVNVSGLTNAKAISHGSGNGLAIRADGTLATWGQGSGLGDGLDSHPKICPHPNNNDCLPTPGSVVGITTASKISAGSGGACALLTSGAISCWGDDGNGELGNGLPATSSNAPVSVSGIADATSLSRRVNVACAMRAGGVISCWGRNLFGNLANGATANVTPAPTTVVW